MHITDHVKSQFLIIKIRENAVPLIRQPLEPVPNEMACSELFPHCMKHGSWSLNLISVPFLIK